MEIIQKAFEAFAVESTGGVPFLPSIRVEEALRMAGATDLSVGECVFFALLSFLLLPVFFIDHPLLEVNKVGFSP